MLNTGRKTISNVFNSYEQEEKGKIIVALNIQFVEAILGDNRVRFFLGVLIHR